MPISSRPIRKSIKSANKNMNLNATPGFPQYGEKINDFQKSNRSEKGKSNIYQFLPENVTNPDVATLVCEKGLFYEGISEEQSKPKSHPLNIPKIVIPEREQVYDDIPDWQPKLKDALNEQDIVIPEREQVYEDVPEWETQLKIQPLKKKLPKPISEKEQVLRDFIPQFKGTYQSKLLHSKKKNALQMNVTVLSKKNHKRNSQIKIPKTAAEKCKTDVQTSSSTEIQNTVSDSLKHQQSSGGADYASHNFPVLLRSRTYTIEKPALLKNKPSAVERPKLKTLSNEHIEYCKNMCYDHLYKVSFLKGVLTTDSPGQKIKEGPKCSEKHRDVNSFNVRGKKEYATVPCTKYPNKFSKKPHRSFDCIGESTRCPRSYTKCTEACQIVSEEICVIHKEKVPNPQGGDVFPIDAEKCKYRHQKCFQTNFIVSPKLHRRLSSNNTVYLESTQNSKEKKFSTKATIKKTDTSHSNIKDENFSSSKSTEHKLKDLSNEFTKSPKSLKTNDSLANTRKCPSKTNTKREVKQRAFHKYNIDKETAPTINSNSQPASSCSKITLENQVEKKDISDHFRKMLKIPSKIIKENTKKMLSPNSKTKPKSSSQYTSKTFQADSTTSKDEIKTNKQRCSSKVIDTVKYEKIKEASQIPKLLNMDQERITASLMAKVKKSSPLKEFIQLKKPVDEEKSPNSNLGKAGTSKTSLTETISKFCQRFSPKRSPIKEDSEERKLISSSSSESDKDLKKVTVKRKSLLPTARNKTNNRAKNKLMYFSQNSEKKDLTEPLFNAKENEMGMSCEANKIDLVVEEEQSTDSLLFKDTLSCLHKNEKVSISCNVHLATSTVLTGCIRTEDSTSDEYSSIPDTEDFPRNDF